MGPTKRCDQEGSQLPEDQWDKGQSTQRLQGDGSIPGWTWDDRTVQQELCSEQGVSVPEDEARMATECCVGKIQDRWTWIVCSEGLGEGTDDCGVHWGSNKGRVDRSEGKEVRKPEQRHLHVPP